jgi:HAD superfamily hydrolase (TIGR01662 family)
MSELRAVLFDVDFTLAKPGPELGAEGYRRRGEQFGLDLDPARYENARAAAAAELKHHPELVHDDEIWVAFTQAILVRMGAEPAKVRECAVDITRAWEQSANFELYEDVHPVFEALRERGLKIGLLSNTGRDLETFARHHGLSVEVAISSRSHGWTKPHPTIFAAVLERMHLRPHSAAMVGDSLHEDVEGARAIGMRALLLDREDRYPEVEERLSDLFALPAALGITTVRPPR